MNTISETIAKLMREQQARLHEFADYASIEVRMNDYKETVKDGATFSVYTGQQFGVGATEGEDLEVIVDQHITKIRKWKSRNTPVSLAAQKRAEAEKLMREAAELEASPA